jgi:diguanylate cyclase (GGDEF)-like protein
METRVQTVTGKSRLEAADDVRRRLFVIVVAAVVAPVNVAFLVADVLAANTGEIITDAVLLVLLGVLIVSLGRLRNPRTVYRVVLLVAGGLMVWWAFDPGPENAKLFWALIFAPIAMFVLGKTEGLIWALVHLLACGLAIAGLLPGSTAEGGSLISRYLSAHGIIIGLSYVFEYSRERTYAHLLTEHEDLRAAHSQIREMSITDTLTGVYNRQYLADGLPTEVERSRRYNHSLSLILCDVDRFKHVNDTLGHLAGDKVLVSIAQALERAIRRDVDWIVRYGGEEFIIVLPETPLAGAEAVAERLRVAVESTRVEAGGQQVSCTASFGAAALEGEEKPASADDLIREADRCLYEAKRQGRNRVVARAGKRNAPARGREIR